MSSATLGRIAGWSTLLAWPAIFAGFATGNDLVIAVATVLSIPLLYALLVAHRGRSGNLAVLGGLLGIGGFVLQAVSASNSEGPVYMVGSVAVGLGILAFGYLGLSSSVVPKWVAAMGVAAGIAQIAMAFVTGDAAETSIIPPIALVTQLVWTIWLAVTFLRGKLIEA